MSDFSDGQSGEPQAQALTRAPSFFAEARRTFHATLLAKLLFADNGIPTNADKKNRASVAIAKGIISQLGQEIKVSGLLVRPLAGSLRTLSAALFAQPFYSLITFGLDVGMFSKSRQEIKQSLLVSSSTVTLPRLLMLLPGTPT